MPRIEIIPENFDFESGDGTPTIDVCRRCYPDFIEGEAAELSQYPNAVIGCVEVEHPPYSEWDYRCRFCNNDLTDRDNLSSVVQ